MYWRLYSILSLPVMSRAVLMHEIAKNKSRQIVLTDKADPTATNLIVMQHSRKDRS